MATNIGAYFEIPVTDLDRAINFYQSLLGIELERGSIHGYEMAFFPFENNGAGISGALCKGDVYKPKKVEAIDQALCFQCIGSVVGLSFLQLNSGSQDFWGIAISVKGKINSLVFR